MPFKSRWPDVATQQSAASAARHVADVRAAASFGTLRPLAVVVCLGCALAWPSPGNAQVDGKGKQAGLPGPSASMPSAMPADTTMALGKKLFTQLAVPACASCHTLKDAGSSGEIGPIFDELKPDAHRVATAVRNGIGIMPGYGSSLTDAEIGALAMYVSVASGGAK